MNHHTKAHDMGGAGPTTNGRKGEEYLGLAVVILLGVWDK